jgi:hypothetical protein
MDEFVGLVYSLDHNEIGSGSVSPVYLPSCTSSVQLVEVNAPDMSSAKIATDGVTRELYI